MTPALFSRRVILPDGMTPATVFIKRGLIHSIIRSPKPAAACTDLGNLILMPGIVDTHVHVNEPGRTDWEGFATAGRAAAAGGTTTMVVMPLNCEPVATTVAALRLEAAAAKRSCMVDHGFWGGLIPGNQRDLEPLWNAGVLGFKRFMAPSGLDSFPRVSQADLRRAMPVLAKLGATLLAHAEDRSALARARVTSGLDANPRGYARYLASRPKGAEALAISTLALLALEHKTRIHIVHLANASKLRMLRRWRGRGDPISVETCPHYLTFSAADIPAGATQFKCAPPIRDPRNRSGLWSGLARGDIDLIASDHSPCPPDLKHLETGDFARAWGGIASLQLSLPAVWTEAHRRGFSPVRIARWMCEAPARLAGVDGLKGRIAPGLHADFVVWDPSATFTVRAANLEHRHKLTPYDGRTLRGVVRATILRGQLVFDTGLFGPHRRDPFPKRPLGQWVKRPT